MLIEAEANAVEVDVAWLCSSIALTSTAELGIGGIFIALCLFLNQLAPSRWIGFHFLIGIR